MRAAMRRCRPSSSLPAALRSRPVASSGSPHLAHVAWSLRGSSPRSAASRLASRSSEGSEMRRAFVLLALAGCSQILGIDDVTHVDGGAPPNTVIGRFYSRYRTPSGVTDVPRDISNMIIKVMIPDAAQPTGFLVVDGVGQAD